MRKNMMFDRNKSLKINKMLFDKKAIKINTQARVDKLFADLEQAITENEYIVVNDSMHDYWVEQAIMTFLNRYKIFIEFCYTDMSAQNGMTYIKLKNKRKSTSDLGYSELEASYSEDYYLNDCGGYDDFKKSNGKAIDQRLQDVFYLINPSEHEKILDIGCGRGELAYALAVSGADVIGIDYSEAAIRIARKTYGGG
jgi:2-polyprenyl-3-methyl-5-hydroxy-6-metoxy-1,4-benzoquinol methylase